jgi:protein-S-isoprenylcysteine O-methyltransferase Ste14
MLKVVVAVAILLLIIGIAMLGKRLKSAFIFRGITTPSSESIWIEAIALLLGIGLAIADYVMKRPDPGVVGWIGVVLFFSGGLFQLFTRKVLGEFKTFSDKMKTDVEVARNTRIYKHLRHPSKFALLLMAFGLALSLVSWWGMLLLAILFIPALLFRTSQEERTFIDEFGELYITYQGETRKLIPGML